MALRVTMTVTGARELATELRKAGKSLAAPADPLLRLLAAQAVTFFQEHIAEGGGRLAADVGAWPPLSPVTQRVRRARGHTPNAPLLRDGTLSRSIGTLEFNDTEIVVGTRHAYAGINQFGGLESEVSNFPGVREVPARPFVGFADDEVEELLDQVGGYFFEVEGGVNGPLA